MQMREINYCMSQKYSKNSINYCTVKINCKIIIIKIKQMLKIFIHVNKQEEQDRTHKTSSFFEKA